MRQVTDCVRRWGAIGKGTLEGGEAHAEANWIPIDRRFIRFVCDCEWATFIGTKPRSRN
jgi:hypothetical protein